MTVSSAGVYNSAGLLVRTLWSAQTDDIRATNPAATWNGLMDDGTAAPAGTYTIKLLQNNCTYNWDGSLGNTSPDHTSSVLYHAWEECIADMAITAGGEIYFTSVDNERRVVAQVATTANPQTCRPVVPQAFRATYGNTTFVCADATRVYWGMFDGGVPDSFGWAVGQANGAFNNLTQKSPYQPPSGHTGRGFGVVTNLYAYNTTPGKSFEGTPGGIAVQQTGNYLYLSRPYQNKITTSNKTSGADLQINTTIMQPNRMAINPADDSLWVIHAVYTATHGVQFNGTSQDVRFAAINYGVAGAARSWSAWFKTTATSGCIFAQTTSTTDPATATTWAATMYIGSDGKLYGGMWTGAANTINSVAVVNDGNWHLGAFTVSATGVCNLYVDQGQPVTATFSAPSEAWWTDTWIANGKGDGFTNAGTGDRWFNGSLADCRVYSSVISVLEVSNLYLGQNANSAAKAEYTFQTVSATDASGNGFNGVIAGSPTGVTGPIQIGPLFVAPTATVEKYTADGSGNLSSTGVTIATALNNPICLDVDPTGATLLVVDGANLNNYAYKATGTSQVYAFNTSDGSVKTAFGTSGKFGTAGGYINSPAVTNTKWCFTSVNPHAAQSFLRFAPDGSWWLGDQGNYRCLHFSSGNSPTYIEQIMTIPLFYSQRIVRNGNDFTRVLVNLLEFSVDYTKSLSPTNGSWTLTYNWSGNLSSTQVEVTQGIFTLLNFATVCSNGRTYGLGRSSSAGNRIWEMNPTTGIRDTSIILLNNAYLDKNFNQWLYWPNNAAGSFPVGTPQQQAGQQSFLYENPFTGFDGSNNPTWQFTTGVPDAQYQHAGQLVYTSQVYPSNFSYNNQGGDAGLEECKIERTAGGLIIFFSTTMTNPYVYTDAKGHLFGLRPAN